MLIEQRKQQIKGALMRPDCPHTYAEISQHVPIFKTHIGRIVSSDVELTRLINKNRIERRYGVYLDGIKAMFDAGEHNISMIATKLNISSTTVNRILCLYDLVGVTHRNKKAAVLAESVYPKPSMKKKHEQRRQAAIDALTSDRKIRNVQSLAIALGLTHSTAQRVVDRNDDVFNLLMENKKR